MTREEIISGLKFTVEMFLLDPSTGETITEPRNDMDKTTIDACRGAIELLEQEPCEDAVSRQAVLEYIEGSEAELGHSSENELVCQDIKELPPVKLQGPKIGHWITEGRLHPKCDQCGWEYGSNITNFCPDCGAKMIDPQESEDKE